MMDRGGDSINNILNYILFNIAPTIVDILIAIGYFTSTFGAYFGLIVFTTMGGYMWYTVVVTEWRTKFRRGMNTRDNAVRQKATDSLINVHRPKLAPILYRELTFGQHFRPICRKLDLDRIMLLQDRNY